MRVNLQIFHGLSTQAGPREYTYTFSPLHLHTHYINIKDGIRRIIPTIRVPRLTIRDQQIRGTTVSPIVPSNIRATVNSSLTNARDADRGIVREYNERTASTRSYFFLKQCYQRQFYYVIFLERLLLDAQRIISSYAFDIESSKNTTKTQYPYIKSVQVYVPDEPAIVLHHSHYQPNYRYKINQLGQQTTVFTADLQSIFDTITAWCEENGETEPLTAEIITVLYHLTYFKCSPCDHTYLLSAIFDIQVLLSLPVESSNIHNLECVEEIICFEFLSINRQE